MSDCFPVEHTIVWLYDSLVSMAFRNCEIVALLLETGVSLVLNRAPDFRQNHSGL